MTGPVGRAALEIVAEADPRKLARQIERDANRALRQVDLDTDPIADKIGEGARKAGAALGDEIEDGARRAGDAIDGLGPKGSKAGRDLRMSLGAVVGVLAVLGKAFGVFTLGATGAVALAGAIKLVIAAAVALVPAIGAGLATLPGIILGAAAAFGVLKIATLGFSDALKAVGDPAKFAEAVAKLSPAAAAAAVAVRDLTTALKPVQQAIQQAFFVGVASAVSALGDSALELRNEAVGVATALGGVVRAVLALGASDQVITPLAQVMRALPQVLDAFAAGLGPVTVALAGIAGQAAQFAGVVAQALTGGLARLAENLATVDLAGLFERAQTVLAPFVALLSNVGTILAAVFNAIAGPGGQALGVIGGLVSGMAEFVKSAEGAAVLGALGEALRAIAGGVGQFFLALLKAIAPLLLQLAPVVATLVQTLAGGLAPALAVIGPAAGVLLDALLPLAGIIGRFAATLLPPVVRLVAALDTALAPLIDVIVQIVDQLLTSLEPVLTVIIDVIGQLIPPTGELLLALLPLVPALLDIVIALLPLIAPILKLAAALVSLLVTEAVVPLVKLLVDALVLLLKPAEFGAEAIGKLGPLLEGIDWGGVGSAIADAFTTAWNATVNFFLGISRFFAALPGQVAAFLASLPQRLLDAFTTAFKVALQAVGMGIGLLLAAVFVLPGKILEGLKALPGLLVSFFTSLWSTVRSITTTGVNAVVSFVAGIIPRIGAALAALPGLLARAFTSALAAARSVAVSGFNAIVSVVASIPGRLAGLAGRMLAAGRALIGGFFSGLGAAGGFVGNLAGRIVGAIKGLLNNVIGSINAGIASVDNVLPGSLPRIPFLQRGGLTTAEGPAYLHPRELVLPLDSSRATDMLARAMADADRAVSTTTTGDTYVYVEIDGQQLEGRIIRTVRAENDERDRALRRRVTAR